MPLNKGIRGGYFAKFNFTKAKVALENLLAELFCWVLR